MRGGKRVGRLEVDRANVWRGDNGRVIVVSTFIKGA